MKNLIVSMITGLVFSALTMCLSLSVFVGPNIFKLQYPVNDWIAITAVWVGCGIFIGGFIWAFSE